MPFALNTRNDALELPFRVTATLHNALRRVSFQNVSKCAFHVEIYFGERHRPTNELFKVQLKEPAAVTQLQQQTTESEKYVSLHVRGSGNGRQGSRTRLVIKFVVASPVTACPALNVLTARLMDHLTWPGRARQTQPGSRK